MAMNFDPALGDPVSQVRFLLGDTSPPRHEVEDETIGFFLTTKTVAAAAAALAWGVVAKYAKIADVAVDNQLTKYSKVYDHWLILAKHLDKEAGAGPFSEPPAASSYARVMVTGLGDRRGPLDMESADYYASRGWP